MIRLSTCDPFHVPKMYGDVCIGGKGSKITNYNTNYNTNIISIILQNCVNLESKKNYIWVNGVMC